MAPDPVALSGKVGVADPAFGFARLIGEIRPTHRGQRTRKGDQITVNMKPRKGPEKAAPPLRGSKIKMKLITMRDAVPADVPQHCSLPLLEPRQTTCRHVRFSP